MITLSISLDISVRKLLHAVTETIYFLSQLFATFHELSQLTDPSWSDYLRIFYIHSNIMAIINIHDVTIDLHNHDNSWKIMNIHENFFFFSYHVIVFVFLVFWTCDCSHIFVSNEIWVHHRHDITSTSTLTLTKPTVPCFYIFQWNSS